MSLTESALGIKILKIIALLLRHKMNTIDHEMPAKTGQCALCGREGPLRDSHVIPRFAGLWIKRTGTGFLWLPSNPDRRCQDLPKAKLLCGSCEKLLNPSETEFSRCVFQPYHKGRTRSFPYSSWLHGFSVGLTWKALTVSLKSGGGKGSPYYDAAVIAANTWSDYLLGRRPDAGPYEQHLWFAREVFSRSPDLPRYLHWTLERGTAATVIESRKGLKVLAKLPGLVFCAAVFPSTLPLWQGTLLMNDGTITFSQRIYDDDFAFWVVNNAHDTFVRLSNSRHPSYRQRVQEFFGDQRGEIERATFAWQLADNLAGRATPEYDDSAARHLVGLTKGEVRAWLMQVQTVTEEERPEGPVCVVTGVPTTGAADPLTFILRGQWEIPVGAIIQYCRKAGYSAPLIQMEVTSQTTEDLTKQ